MTPKWKTPSAALPIYSTEPVGLAGQGASWEFCLNSVSRHQAVIAMEPFYSPIQAVKQIHSPVQLLSTLSSFIQRGSLISEPGHLQSLLYCHTWQSYPAAPSEAGDRGAPGWAIVICSLWTDNFKIKVASCLDKKERSSISHSWGQGTTHSQKDSLGQKRRAADHGTSCQLPRGPGARILPEGRALSQAKARWSKTIGQRKPEGLLPPPHKWFKPPPKHMFLSSSLALSVSFSLPFHPYPWQPALCLYFLCTYLFTLLSLNKHLIVSLASVSLMNSSSKRTKSWGPAGSG